MASLAELRYEITVKDANGLTQQRGPVSQRFTPGAGTNGHLETVTLTNGEYTGFTVPTGAKFLAIFLPVAAESLVLKGPTGDTGVKITPASAALGLPVLLPLGASPEVGILNNDASDHDAELLWI